VITAQVRVLVFAVAATLAATNPAGSQTVLWEPTSGPEGGNIVSMTSNGQGHLFASAGEGGMFRSLNGGASWEAINNHDPGFESDSFQPHDVWVNPATQTLLVANGCRIFRFEDNGDYWTHTGLALDCVGTPMAARQNGGPIYAGGRTTSGLLRSDDDGRSWAAVTMGEAPLPRPVLRLAVDSQSALYAATDNGVFRSSDEGQNWTPYGLQPHMVTALRFDPSRDALFAGTQWEEENGFPSFHHRHTSDADWTTGTPPGGWIYQVTDFAFTPGAIFGASSQNTGVFRSTDEGATWEHAGLGSGDGPGYNAHTVRTLTVTPDHVVFAGTQEGVFRYDGPSAQWAFTANGMRATYIRSLLFTSQGDLFAGTWAAGIGRTSDRGHTWTQAAQGYVNDIVTVDGLAETPSGELFAAMGAIIKSTDGGSTWTSVTPGYDVPGPSCAPHLSIAASMTGQLYASSYCGVLRSSDLGVSWEQMGLSDRQLELVALSPNGRIFAAGGRYPGLWRFVDQSATWEAVGLFTDEVWIRSIAFNSKGHVFVSSYTNGFQRSEDDGTTWSGPLDNMGYGVGPIAVNGDDVIFKGPYLRRSLDNGATWEDWSAGMETPQRRSEVLALALDSDGFLYAGMWSGGVWRSTVTTRIVKNVRIDIKPGSYPNSINLGSNGKIPVAILSAEDFDATTVDPASVTLAGARIALKGKGTYMYSFQDVNGDDRSDMVIHVLTNALELSSTDTMAELEGQTYSGQRIRGVDTVRVVPD
jgi:photosystem II stability/assembly factor-like uncharacterized protein